MNWAMGWGVLMAQRNCRVCWSCKKVVSVEKVQEMALCSMLPLYNTKGNYILAHSSLMHTYKKHTHKHLQRKLKTLCVIVVGTQMLCKSIMFVSINMLSRFIEGVVLLMRRSNVHMTPGGAFLTVLWCLPHSPELHLEQGWQKPLEKKKV